VLGNECLRRLYELTIDNLNVHNYPDAIFFCDKLVTLGGGHIAAVYLLGECYFRNGNFKKVHSLFLHHKLLAHNISFQLLAARALLLNRQNDQCLAMLETQLENTYCNRKMESCKAFIRAQCFEAQDNKLMAIEAYQECIQKDPTNVEAFNRLVDCQLITGAQKEQLLASLSFAPEDQWLRKIYLSKVKEVEEVAQVGVE
jgi:tetratricopeptide (TPR) repeat protein